MAVERGRPNVKLVRGPFVRLDPHPQHCDTADEFFRLCRELRRAEPGALLAADLFSGAGGMSLGLQQAGMRVVFGADHDAEALETHRHHFGGLSVDWDLGDSDVVEEVGRLLRVARVDVLAGGPPCQPFSKAGRSGMRHLVREGLREPHDRRRDLWRSYLEVVRLAKPRAVIMENVPDMALDREMFILRSMVLTLEQLGYSVQERVVDTWRYGVPQFRQRLILVAVRGRSEFTWPRETPKKVTLGNAISDLPPVDGGWRPKGGAAGFKRYEHPKTAYQREMRQNVPDDEFDKVFDHITRPVRPDDLAAFELLDSKTRYSELPVELKRYRDDIFDDKYKRLDADDLSRTITAHIAKDGYWYIHPEQNRTLTIREAARLQTFPDEFRFAGSPSAAFRQIGNAVPPRLGRAIGSAVGAALGGPSAKAVSSEEIGQALASWFRNAGSETNPWLTSNSRWHVLMGEMLLERESDNNIRSLWPHLEKWSDPGDVLQDAETLRELAAWIDRRPEAENLLQLASVVVDRGNAELHDDLLNECVVQGLVRRTSVELAMIVDSEGEEPVIPTAGALRVAGRFYQGHERWLTNRHSEGRIAVARLVGYGVDSRAAHLGLIELASSVCSPKAPACPTCPLQRWCKSAH